MAKDRRSGGRRRAAAEAPGLEGFPIDLAELEVDRIDESSEEPVPRKNRPSRGKAVQREADSIERGRRETISKEERTAASDIQAIGEILSRYVATIKPDNLADAQAVNDVLFQIETRIVGVQNKSSKLSPDSELITKWKGLAENFIARSALVQAAIAENRLDDAKVELGGLLALFSSAESVPEDAPVAIDAQMAPSEPVNPPEAAAESKEPEQVTTRADLFKAIYDAKTIAVSTGAGTVQMNSDDAAKWITKMLENIAEQAASVPKQPGSNDRLIRGKITQLGLPAFFQRALVRVLQHERLLSSAVEAAPVVAKPEVTVKAEASTTPSSPSFEKAPFAATLLAKIKANNGVGLETDKKSTRFSPKGAKAWIDGLINEFTSESFTQAVPLEGRERAVRSHLEDLGVSDELRDDLIRLFGELGMFSTRVEPAKPAAKVEGAAKGVPEATGIDFSETRSIEDVIALLEAAGDQKVIRLPEIDGSTLSKQEVSGKAFATLLKTAFAFFANEEFKDMLPAQKREKYLLFMNSLPQRGRLREMVQRFLTEKGVQIDASTDLEETLLNPNMRRANQATEESQDEFEAIREREEVVKGRRLSAKALARKAKASSPPPIPVGKLIADPTTGESLAGATPGEKISNLITEDDDFAGFLARQKDGESLIASGDLGEILKRKAMYESVSRVAEALYQLSVGGLAEDFGFSFQQKEAKTVLGERKDGFVAYSESLALQDPEGFVELATRLETYVSNRAKIRETEAKLLELGAEEELEKIIQEGDRKVDLFKTAHKTTGWFEWGWNELPVVGTGIKSLLAGRYGIKDLTPESIETEHEKLIKANINLHDQLIGPPTPERDADLQDTKEAIQRRKKLLLDRVNEYKEIQKVTEARKKVEVEYGIKVGVFSSDFWKFAIRLTALPFDPEKKNLLGRYGKWASEVKGPRLKLREEIEQTEQKVEKARKDLASLREITAIREQAVQDFQRSRKEIFTEIPPVTALVGLAREQVRSIVTRCQTGNLEELEASLDLASQVETTPSLENATGLDPAQGIEIAEEKEVIKKKIEATIVQNFTKILREQKPRQKDGTIFVLGQAVDELVKKSGSLAGIEKGEFRRRMLGGLLTQAIEEIAVKDPKDKDLPTKKLYVATLMLKYGLPAPKKTT